MKECINEKYDECASGLRSACHTLKLKSLSKTGRKVTLSWIYEWKRRMLYYDKKLMELGEK